MTNTKPAGKPSKKARLTAARLAAVQCVYEMAVAGVSARAAFDHYTEDLMGQPLEGDVYIPADLDLLAVLVNGVSGRRDDLRAMVQGALPDKKTEPLLQAILYCGLYELLDRPETDVPVIINDYVNIAHGFYEQAEAGLVNAVLDRQANNLRA